MSLTGKIILIVLGILLLILALILYIKSKKKGEVFIDADTNTYPAYFTPFLLGMGLTLIGIVS